MVILYRVLKTVMVIQRRKVFRNERERERERCLLQVLVLKVFT